VFECWINTAVLVGGGATLTVHLVTQQLFDLSQDLSDLAERDTGFRLTTDHGDEFAHGSP